jgi:hypothetical protein
VAHRAFGAIGGFCVVAVLMLVPTAYAGLPLWTIAVAGGVAAVLMLRAESSEGG